MSDQIVTPDSPVTLREVTRENLRAVLNLSVAPSQMHQVATNAQSIAEAHFEPAAWMRAIYADETPVGFLMMYEKPDEGVFYLWRLMVDAQYQAMGFGRRALEQLIARVCADPNATDLTLSVVPGADGAAPFYERLGFIDTGVMHHGEQVYRLPLATRRADQPPVTLSDDR